MGKILDKYMAEYKEATSAAKPGDLVVPAELWISSKWETDNGVSPWEPEHKRKFDEAMARDPEFGAVLFSGFEMMMEVVKKASGKGLGHENQN